MATLSHLNRMLILEDQALILLDLEMTLAEAGVAEIYSATTTDDAMAIVERGGLDAAVLDLHLGATGWSYDVARRLEALKVPFIFSSGTVDIADGFQHVPLLTKPFSEDQLLSALLQVTADRETMAAQ
jgi:CheY-like chemotaxis protein